MPRKKNRLTKQQLSNEVEGQLRDHSKEVLEKYWAAVKRKLDDGDNRTLELVGRMFQYDKGPGGVTIFNQHLQVNGGATHNAVENRLRSFDQIIGKLDEESRIARENRLLAPPPPVENSDPDNDEYDDDPEDDDAPGEPESIADAETEDLPLSRNDPRSNNPPDTMPPSDPWMEA